MCSRWSNSLQLDRFPCPFPSVLLTSCGDSRWGCGSENSCVGVCPKLLMIASICILSFSSSIFSRLTLSAHRTHESKLDGYPYIHTLILHTPHLIPHTPYPTPHTLIGVVVVEIGGLLCLWACLLVAKDEVYPVMQLAGDIVTLLEGGRERERHGRRRIQFPFYMLPWQL